MVSRSSGSSSSTPSRSAPPTPRARRQAQQLGLQSALAARDPQLVDQMLAHWVHRHGVSSMNELWSELAQLEPEGCRWWHEQHARHEQAKQPSLEPLQPVPLEPRLPAMRRPAPAPSHPALVSLRSWLPDQETPRAA